MRVVLSVLAIITITTTVLPLLRSDRWWIRIWDFPRLQILTIAVACLVGLLTLASVSGFATTDVVLIPLLFGAIIYQVYMMFPYMPWARRQVEDSASASPPAAVSLVFANVLMQNRNAEGLLTLIRENDPDIVLAVETDAWWKEQLSSLERTHPRTVLQPQENEYGMLLYSRLPLSSEAVKYLVDNEVPSIHATAHLPGGHTIALRCLHPRPPFPTEDKTATDRDAEVLIVGREIKDSVLGPAIVFGDLNDVAWSRTNYLFQNISGLLDPRVGRGFFNTFHASYPFIRFPLDHFFHSNHFQLVDFRRLAYFGSDHFPVYIKLSIAKEAVIEQEELEATPEEEQEAAEKIRAAFEAS